MMKPIDYCFSVNISLQVMMQDQNPHHSLGSAGKKQGAPPGKICVARGRPILAADRPGRCSSSETILDGPDPCAKQNICRKPSSLTNCMQHT